MNAKRLNKREVIDFINSFNNAGFIKIESVRIEIGNFPTLVSRKFHFESTKFAASGIAQTYNVVNDGGNAYHVLIPAPGFEF